MPGPSMLSLNDGTSVDLALAGRDELVEAVAARLMIENDDLLRALKNHDDLSEWAEGGCEDRDDDDEPVLHRGDFGEAIDRVKRARGDDPRCLPDVLHYLTRAVPDLFPLIALLERETGRKLSP